MGNSEWLSSAILSLSFFHASGWEGLAFVVGVETSSKLGKGFYSPRTYWFRHEGLSHWGSSPWAWGPAALI